LLSVVFIKLFESSICYLEGSKDSIKNISYLVKLSLNKGNILNLLFGKKTQKIDY